MRKLFLSLLLWPLVVLGTDYPINADTKKFHPPHPEEGGLRLEVSARLGDSIVSDGKEARWDGATLSIEVAVRNISKNPITVPTVAWDGKVEKQNWPSWGPGIECIRFFIAPPKFQGKPTVFASSRFAPVVLAPGEQVLLWHHAEMISDRKRVDSVKEVSVGFSVSPAFGGENEWWKGYLQTYAEIQRPIDPEKEIAKMKADQVRYDAEREAEKDPKYGPIMAARAAALIASTDRVGIRGESEKEAAEVVVRDAEWIRRVSEAVAALPFSGRTNCFCAGWRTAYFYKDGQKAISVAAIHGNQIRISWTDDDGHFLGGDYPLSEEQWKVLCEALELPKASNQSSDPIPRVTQQDGHR